MICAIARETAIMANSSVFQSKSGLNIQTIDIEIEVVEGTGSAPFYCTGTVKTICFKPPEDSSEFDYTIVDEMEYGLAGETELAGSNTITVEFLCANTNLLSLSNADDGTYYVRIYAIV